MDDVQTRMNNIHNLKNPNSVEVLKYIRYLINVKDYDPDQVYEDVTHWDKSKIAMAIKDVYKENNRPKPKRYYVSLKDPLNEQNTR
jgi:hypothetical protein